MANVKANKEITVEGVTFVITQIRPVGAKYVVSVKGEELGFASTDTLTDARRIAEEYVAAIELEADIAKVEAAKAFDLEADDAALEAEVAKFSDPLDLLFS